MQFSRSCRAGVLCIALLVPVLVTAPLATAAASHHAGVPAKKKCKKGYVRKGKKCKKKSAVGALDPKGGTTSPIGVDASPTGPGASADAAGSYVVVGNTTSAINGQLTDIKYFASTKGTIRFLLLNGATGVVKAMTDPITAISGLQMTYTLPLAWNVAIGDRLGVWEATPVLNFTAAPKGSLGPVISVLWARSPAAPTVGAAVPNLGQVNRAYPFGGTVVPRGTTVPTKPGFVLHKKKCKKGYVKRGKKCKKKTVGAGPTASSPTPIGSTDANIVSRSLFDTGAPTAVIAAGAATQAGSISAIKYFGDRPGTIQFLLVSSAGVVKAVTGPIAVTPPKPTTKVPTETPAPTASTYTLPAEWRVNAGDQLGLWQDRAVIGYGAGGVGPSFQAPSPSPPAVGATLAPTAVKKTYSFGAMVTPAGSPPPCDPRDPRCKSLPGGNCPKTGC